MIGRRQTSLLFACLLFSACASGPPAAPDIPASVSPGWQRSALYKSALPPGVQTSVQTNGSPACWRADYTGPGTANVWLCWYKESASAFEAAQRTPAAAQTVKFQEGQYLVLVKWNDTPKANLTALIRAIQKAVQAK